jgi:hypothetical protein
MTILGNTKVDKLFDITNFLLPKNVKNYIFR